MAEPTYTLVYYWSSHPGSCAPPEDFALRSGTKEDIKRFIEEKDLHPLAYAVIKGPVMKSHHNKRPFS